ncbi:MAG: KUP/HAK/KT family potassium transporter [Bacteroidota bacterium]|nr:KUP/HAK/KT family potassium transporter [Bacteroidota bacterium]MDP4204550.1 KUP/HAK/KT family potassium transporter [Bacteroidota bacterium]
MESEQKKYLSKVTLSGLIITLGIVFGDLGTSPLYVMKAIVAGSMGTIDPDFIMGAISCVFWTLTLQTTIKYVLITMRADNKGEGGIFSLYALIRKRKKWVYIFAIIGGSALLADGIITPSITVVSAVEGLSMIDPNINAVPISLAIITGLFAFQQFGTNVLGKSFGPIMVLWFLMLGVVGFSQILTMPSIFMSLNPYFAIKLLTTHPGGFLLLGAVFLCTTGAEALYSDLGHCGFHNIRVSWFYVKTCLVLNYLGQGAWILKHSHEITPDLNPFFTVFPSWFLVPSIILATGAAVIASQALISGSFTIISEGILLNFWPKVQIKYPSKWKGQMYIPSVNAFLFIACMFVVAYFRKSSNMEAAYGLSITITMLMTSLLMFFYLRIKRTKWYFLGLFMLTYLSIEISFLIANLHKFANGGWFTIMMATLICSVMYIWYRARSIRNRFLGFVDIKNYSGVLTDIKADTEIPKVATNLAYITKADNHMQVESKIIYSIINKHPKRADLYWFIHLDVLDDPFTMEYKLQTLIPNVLMRVEFRIGFKVQPRINLFIQQVIHDLTASGEMDMLSKYISLHKHNVPSDFKYVLISMQQTYDFAFKSSENMIMYAYRYLKKIGISDVKAYGLDFSSIIEEKVPMKPKVYQSPGLKRIKSV